MDSARAHCREGRLEAAREWKTVECLAGFALFRKGRKRQASECLLPVVVPGVSEWRFVKSMAWWARRARGLPERRKEECCREYRVLQDWALEFARMSLPVYWAWRSEALVAEAPAE